LKILKIFLWCVALVCELPRLDSALTDEQFEVAEGLVVQPFATQGQLSNPASIDVDERGRVWVAEAFNYRKKTRKAGDRILILEDSNGDGRADMSNVFYQNPDIDGVHGVCVLGNKAIVSAPDKILLLTDTDGDDKADTKKLLFTGKVLNPVNGQHDHAIHAVMFGPDGRLYFNFGNFNAGLWHADGSLVRDVFGIPVNNSRKPYQEGMVIRCELDGNHVEVLGYNFRNNWEVTVDSFGTMWQSDNDNGSSSCRVNFVMEYGNYGYRDEQTGADYRNKRTNMEATMQRRMWHQNDPGVVPNLLITGSGSPTGILVYEGDLLPEPFRGQMIHAEPGRNVVWAFPAKQAGAGYSASIVDVVRSKANRNYRPSDVSVAPDGSLFIADWFDPVDCCHRTLNDAGRIFRVAPPNHIYTVPAYSFKTPAGAVKALQSPNLSARYKAWTTLLGMQERARTALEKMASDNNPRFRARALWALSAIKDGTSRAIEMALGDESENIRALALRIVRRHRLPIEPVVRRLIRDEAALVRRECAVSLHRLASTESVQLWTELASQYDGIDRWYLEALGIGEKGKETACLNTWLKKTRDTWKTAAGRDIIWRSRAPEAAALLAKLLLSPDVPTTEHPRLLRALDFHEDKPKEAALATLLEGDAKRSPATYLEAFQRATPNFLEKHPKTLKQVEATMLASKGTVTFVDMVARLNRKDMAGHLMDMVQATPEKEPGIRAAGQIFAFKEDHRIEAALSDSNQTPAFIKALGFVGNKQAVAMLQTLTTDEARLEASRLLAITALGRSSSGAGVLMQLVQQKKLPAKFMPPAIRSLASSPGPNTRSFAAQQQELLTPVGKRWPIELLLATKPDASKGMAVFQKAGCIACHIVQGEGLDFGPELSDIGNKLSSEQLFEAILNPNQTISLGYEGVNVTLKDGIQLIGFVTSESKTTLSLRIPGGLRKDVLKANIKTRTAMKASLMPTVLEATISPQELVDLVGWLVSKNPAETPTAKNPRAGGLPKKVVKEAKPRSKPGWTPQVTAWRAKLDANDRGMIGKWFATAFDDAKWNTMKLPTFYETAGLPDHDGTVWFRRAIEIPGAHAGKPLTLELGPVDDMDMTWFNGIQVGGIERPGFWTSPRKYTVPGKLVKTGRNVITVRVIDHGWSGGFGGKTTQMRMSAKGLKPVSIAGNWKYQTGITLKALELGALNNPTPPKPTPPPPPAPALVRPLAKKTSPAHAFTNGFQIDGNANVVIIGSANAVESQRHGYLETLLSAAHPTQRFAIRNMAWPADTVYQQQRPRNFFGTAKPSYGEADRRKPLAVNVVFVWLGQSESLEGLAKLDDFTKAYKQTLEQLSTRTSRLVLITPVPFEDPLGLGLDVKKRNANLKHYTAAIRRLGQARKLPVVDLTSSLLGQAITRDGATLSGKGQWLAARTIAVQLGLTDPTLTIRAAATGELIPIPVEELRQTILRKNRLWRQFWLPTNWAFLYGNRQAQPSSRDHNNSGFRWFPEEVQSIVPQLEQMDSLIQTKAQQVIRK